MGLALGLLAVAPANADSVPVTLIVSGGGVTETLVNPDGIVQGDAFSASGQLSTSSWGLNWVVSGDIDPVLNFGIAVTNITATAQDYSFSWLLPVSPALSATVTGGSVSGSLTDGNGNGAFLGQAAGGAPLYEAYIDGILYATLIDAPFTYTVLNPYESSIVAGGNFGLPIPSLAGPAVNSSIGIELAFSLSPGDTATLNGVFVVEEAVVPEPASLSLMGIGCAGLLMGRLRARKRS